jgi:uncharacterized protein
MKSGIDNELLVAVCNDDEQRMAQLLSSGANPNFINEPYGNSALYNSTFSNHLAGVCVLLRAGADPNLRLTYRSPVDGRVERNVVALMYARIPEIARELINAGADVNLVDNAGLTALIRAAQRGALEVVEVLLEAGAQASWRSIEGKSAADTALARADRFRTLARAGNSTALEKHIKEFDRIAEILREAESRQNSAD